MPIEANHEKTYNKQETILDDDGVKIQIDDENGDYIMRVYEVFPGITFVYNDAHIQNVQFKERETTSDETIEISHCREGRLECNIHGEFCYLAPGDIVIAKANSVSSSSYFPLRHYHGLTIQIDLNKTPEYLSALLEGVEIQPKAIVERFYSQKAGFIARANPSFTHIFSELYSVPKTIQKGYFKIKLLELLLFLSVLDTKQGELFERVYTKTQIDLAKRVARYMMEHMDDRITLDHIVEKFHVSGAYIKKIFKGVYGVSIGAYIRVQKMESAAYMLEYTDKSILDIANEHGYNNGSKFASAFRAVKGVNPTEYRNTVLKKMKNI